LTYDEFAERVRAHAQEPGARDMVSIVALRRELRMSASAFDEYVLRLQAEGRVHLMSHVDSASLSADDQAACIRHPAGWLIHWIRWL
jgi:hypothetical protein